MVYIYHTLEGIKDALPICLDRLRHNANFHTTCSYDEFLRCHKVTVSSEHLLNELSIKFTVGFVDEKLTNDFLHLVWNE